MLHLSHYLFSADISLFLFHSACRWGITSVMAPFLSPDKIDYTLSRQVVTNEGFFPFEPHVWHRSLITWVCQIGQLETLKYLLQFDKAKAIFLAERANALFKALKNGHADVVRYLLTYRAVKAKIGTGREFETPGLLGHADVVYELLASCPKARRHLLSSVHRVEQFFDMCFWKHTDKFIPMFLIFAKNHEVVMYLQGLASQYELHGLYVSDHGVCLLGGAGGCNVEDVNNGVSAIMATHPLRDDNGLVPFFKGVTTRIQPREPSKNSDGQLKEQQPPVKRRRLS